MRCAARCLPGVQRYAATTANAGRRAVLALRCAWLLIELQLQLMRSPLMLRPARAQCDVMSTD